MIGILGQGITAQSVMRYFTKKEKSFEVWAQEFFPDDQQESSLFSWIERCQQLVISPGVCPYKTPYTSIPKEKVLTDIDIFFQHVSTKNIIIVTGTNGKTSLVDIMVGLLTAHGFTAWGCGNNELPVLDYLEHIQENHWVILELSSFQLYWVRSLPLVKAAVVTSFSQDHLNWHKDMDDYYQAKARVLSKATLVFTPKGFAQQDHIQYWDQTFNSNSEKSTLFLKGKHLGAVHPLVISSPLLFPLHQALELSLNLGLDQDIVLDFLRSWWPREHRFAQYRIKDILWINDTKATNIEATQAALTSLNPTTDKIYVVMGGESKGQDMSVLDSFYDKAAKFFFIGSAGARMAFFLKDKAIVVDTLDNFFNQLNQWEKPDIVLFSPACASLDQFKHYKHRGEVFHHHCLNYDA